MHSGRATLGVIEGNQERDMHTIRPEGATAIMAAKVIDHVDRVLDTTPHSRLAISSGELRGNFWALVPSHTRTGQWWEIRVSWHDGYVEAGHYGHACEASDAAKHCWHLYAAVLKISQLYYGGMIPVAVTPIRAEETTDDQTQAETPPARQAAGGSRDGFYD